MATFTNIYKQELKNKGVISSLGSAAIKRMGEKVDPRNILFGGKGIFSATGQKIFGKGYSGLSKTPSASKISMGGSDLSAPILNEILISSKTQEAQLKIVAKNTMNNNAMARDINVMRQNIMKLVTMGGGKASRGADMFFKDAAAREKSYESQFGKERGKTVSLTPTPLQKNDNIGLIGLLFSSLSKALTGAITTGLKTLTSGLASILSLDKIMSILGLERQTGLLPKIFAFAGRVLANPFIMGILTATSLASILEHLNKSDKNRYMELSQKQFSEDLTSQERKELENLNNAKFRMEAINKYGYDPITKQVYTKEVSLADVVALQKKESLQKSMETPGKERELEKFKKQKAAEEKQTALEKLLGVTPEIPPSLEDVIKATETSPQSSSPTQTKWKAIRRPGMETSSLPSGNTKPIRIGTGGRNMDNMTSLLDLIGKAESGKWGYNAMNQGTDGPKGPIVGSGNSETIIGKKLTDMTVGEVMARAAKKSDSVETRAKRGLIFAAGKYQFTPETLARMVAKGIVSKEDLFNEQTQDKLAIGLLEEIGALKKAQEGNFDAAQKLIASQWAGMETTGGGTAFVGTANKARVGSGKELQAVLQQMYPKSGSSLSNTSKEAAELNRKSSSSSSAPIVIDNSTKNVTSGGAPMQVSSASAFNNDWFDLTMPKIVSFADIG